MSLALPLPPAPLGLRPRAGRFWRVPVWLRRHPEQSLHYAPLVFRHPGEGAARVLVAHGPHRSTSPVPMHTPATRAAAAGAPMSAAKRGTPDRRHDSKQVSFTIEAEGQDRLLFRVEERFEDQDLTFIVNAPRYLEPPVQDAAPERPTKIVELHFSAHRSIQSETRINAITVTLVTNNGRIAKTKEGNYTKALKHNNWYAHVFAMRCTDLSHRQFLIKAKHNKVNDTASV